MTTRAVPMTGAEAPDRVGNDLDAAVLRAARRGDRGAFEAIYRRYSGRCFTLALRMTGDRAIAEDVVHDTFVKLLGRIRSFRGDASFWTWLRQVTANTTINLLAKRRWLVPVEDIELSAGPRSLGLQDQTGAAAHDVETLLGRLTVQQRTVLLLHDLEGMTHREIAAMFGQTESFSKSVLFRARRRLGELTRS